MKYMGSKSRIVNYILPIIQKQIDDNNITKYIEPFCGGCNVIDSVKCEQKIASDKHKFLIALFQSLDKIDSLPEFITREEYSKVRECFNKKQNTYDDWYIGAVGFLASYNGRFFDGGYAGIVNTKAGTERNYYAEAKRNLSNQISKLSNIEFKHGDYKIYSGSSGCLFYLDPPYKNTKQYGISKNFNHDEFWEWCREMSRKNIVIISEHTAPEDFGCIWSMPVKRTIDNTKRVQTVEKLFQLKK